MTETGNASFNDSVSQDGDVTTTAPNALKIFIIFLVTVVTVLGNIVNIAVISNTKSIGLNTRIFMGFLAIADLGVGIMTSLAIYPSITVSWPYGRVICTISGFVWNLCCCLSIHTILFVTVERYLAVTLPLRYPNIITAQRCVLILISVTMVAIGFLGYSIYKSSSFYSFDEAALLCLPHWGIPSYLVYNLVGFALYFCIPSMLIFFMYFRIAAISRKHSRQIKETSVVPMSSSVTQDGTSNSLESANEDCRCFCNMKATATLFVVAGAFHVFWMPYGVSDLYGSFTGATYSPTFVFVRTWLATSNSFCNFIIYTLLNGHFRRSLTRMFRRFTRRCRRSVGP